MSFKCSVFGHDYGDHEVTREREEDGSEVVITVRETETCVRCGEVRVISENKEVTTLETAADIVADDLKDDPPDSSEPEERVDSTPDAPAERVEPEGVDPANDPQSPPAKPEPIIPDAETGERMTPEQHEQPPEREDDAVILDNDDSGDGADDGEEVTSSLSTGEITGVDVGVGDAADEDEASDGKASDASDTEEERQGRAPGEWPSEPVEEEPEDDWKPSTKPDPEPLDSGSTVEPTGNAVTVPEGEFYCPECEFTTPVVDSSLRAGDFCPECHRGALEHRSD